MLRHFAGQVPLKNWWKFVSKEICIVILFLFCPPKSWTPCRNKLMKCLSLRVHLLDHLTSRLFGKGVTRSSRVLRSLMLTQANGPKRSKAQLLVQHQRGDGFIESYAILCKVELVMVVYVTSHTTRWYWSLSHDMSVREFWHCNYPWHLLHTLNPLPQHPTKPVLIFHAVSTVSHNILHFQHTAKLWRCVLFSIIYICTV